VSNSEISPDSGSQQEEAPTHNTDNYDQLMLLIRSARDVVGITEGRRGVKALCASRVRAPKARVNKIQVSGSGVSS
jgi:hypothetical protein